MKVFVLGILCLLILTSGVYAAQESLGTFSQGSNISLIQTCSSCSYNNLTVIKFPNDTLATFNSVMTQNGSTYNYTLSSDYTGLTGEYLINGIGDLEGTDTIWSYTLKVTYSGKELSASSATFYIVLFSIFIFLFLMTIFFINKLPGMNARDEEGKIIQISRLKYLRACLWFFLWGLIVSLLYIVSNLSFAYLEDALVANFFFVLFRISFGLTLPLVVVWFIWIFVKIKDDKQLSRYWDRGYFPEYEV